jgi:hypothetical protein
MKDLVRIKQNPSEFLSMTSLTVDEFELLYNRFEGYCRDYFFYYTLQGKIRKKFVIKNKKTHVLKEVK